MSIINLLLIFVASFNVSNNDNFPCSFPKRNSGEGGVHVSSLGNISKKISFYVSINNPPSSIMR